MILEHVLWRPVSFTQPVLNDTLFCSRTMQVISSTLDGVRYLVHLHPDRTQCQPCGQRSWHRGQARCSLTESSLLGRTQPWSESRTPPTLWKTWTVGWVTPHIVLKWRKIAIIKRIWDMQILAPTITQLCLVCV